MYDEEKRKNDEPTRYELASMGSRFVASVIDGIILGLVSGLLTAIAGRNGSFALSTLLNFLYYWYFWTQMDGQTPGKMVMHIKIVKTNGVPLTSGDVVLRYLGYWISGICLGMGYLWAIFDERNQGWHDKIAGTYVVRADAHKKKKYVVV
jgi:uncharacterized RDD family membrane protein YckC